jgi:hypothetical protein
VIQILLVSLVFRPYQTQETSSAELQEANHRSTFSSQLVKSEPCSQERSCLVLGSSPKLLSATKRSPLARLLWSYVNFLTQVSREKKFLGNIMFKCTVSEKCPWSHGFVDAVCPIGTSSSRMRWRRLANAPPIQ